MTPTPTPIRPLEDATNDWKNAIITRDVCLWYTKFQALINVSVDIKRGIITSLIGPSGCGKTTLLRCFNRVNERYGYVTTKGLIQIHGKNIYDDDVSLIELRKAVGMVFQRPNPLPISVYENVVFGLRLHREKDALKRSVLDETVEKAALTTRPRLSSSNSNRNSASPACCRSSPISSSWTNHAARSTWKARAPSKS
jgi:ABC-type phosphate transport system ATPase subunit